MAILPPIEMYLMFPIPCQNTRVFEFIFRPSRETKETAYLLSQQLTFILLSLFI